MPEEQAQELDRQAQGWLKTQLQHHSGGLDALLGKRYVVPFALPAPYKVREWLLSIVTLRAYLRLGIDPDDKQFIAIQKASDKADLEIQEAADAVNGKWELPLRTGATTDGIVKGGPRVYSEQSPYVALDIQRSAGMADDQRRRGA